MDENTLGTITFPQPQESTPAIVEIAVAPEAINPSPIVQSTPNSQPPVAPNMAGFANDITIPVPKHPGGRPCEYCKRKDEIDKKVKAYLERATGEKPQMVYLGEICIMLDINKETLQEWAHKKKEDGSLEHEEFSVLVKRAELIQETRLQQRVLGRYNPSGAIFLLKTKHGYMETDKRVLAGDSHDPLEIIITEEDRKRDGE